MSKKSILKSGVGLSLIGIGSLLILNATLADTPPANGKLTLVSTDAAGKIQAGLTSPCAISADGSLVVFNSTASGFVAGDTNNSNDVFLKNVHTGSITGVSTRSNGAQITTRADCQGMSSDGSTIVLRVQTFTAGTGIVPSGNPAGPALFVKHVQSGELQRISPPLAVAACDYRFCFSFNISRW